ncbi:hypothetical protein DACRYDRAFT_15934 [Dacryopinax primogenitus]|uniref:Uncharacterized protein n=1 Tax=Dacryopinax primogenitus (strain DJM 731) TaxID=1858805 RepID=M5FVV5_DACPD|nr:uncharacterized protein DACRYDRAFT_15934 [Dacryopinax primogenitus]EJU01976.1 hypothetical protein DACRYDRAFT_15934 [Dacryopinax primogenitus]
MIISVQLSHQGLLKLKGTFEEQDIKMCTGQAAPGSPTYCWASILVNAALQSPHGIKYSSQEDVHPSTTTGGEVDDRESTMTYDQEGEDEDSNVESVKMSPEVDEEGTGKEEIEKEQSPDRLKTVPVKRCIFTPERNENCD